MSTQRDQSAPWNALLLDDDERHALWERVVGIVEEYIANIASTPVARIPDMAEIQAWLDRVDLTEPADPISSVEAVAKALWHHQVNTPHPRYFGLFNPAPTAMGIAADTIVAALNPQMAAWGHNPLAAEIERFLVRAIGARLGYPDDAVDGTFCSGGAEANHTALLTALVDRFPDYASRGLRALDAQPVLYTSSESHHSTLKAARFCGLGTEAVREIPVDDTLRMRVDALRPRIAEDRAAGFAPFFVVATAGTTNAGIVDDIRAIAQVAEDERLWLHADAAWGGAAAFLPELRPVLDGIERADSITFDAHKWMSVPMAAGIYLTRHPKILERTCATATAYMPRESDEAGAVDPYAHSMQWSRRFIGLKVFLSLAVAGWSGYETAIRHQVAMGRRLATLLEEAGWRIVNQTPLPIACFTNGGAPATLEAIARDVVASGRAWVSTTRVDQETVLRACITNYRTTEADLDELVSALDDARTAVG